MAYRYFSTARRKFIIADTPGHEQYTRNMVTGASTAHAAIVLVDATRVTIENGRAELLAQTKRHSAILKLLELQHVIVAVNKMDWSTTANSASTRSVPPTPSWQPSSA